MPAGLARCCCCCASCTLLQGHEKNLLKELALSREQLKRDLAAARQELELVAGAADAAKEEAAAEVNLLRHQLTAAQAQLEEAQKVGWLIGLGALEAAC